MSPRAAHELSRIGLLAALPGERLAKLGERMRRETVEPGQAVVLEGEDGKRFYVVLSGLLAVTQDYRGARGLLRPGDYFGEVSAALGMPRTATVRAVMPSTVASCDQETFEEFIWPLFADDE